jgi:hypothetical protein
MRASYGAAARRSALAAAATMAHQKFKAFTKLAPARQRSRKRWQLLF